MSAVDHIEGRVGDRMGAKPARRPDLLVAGLAAEQSGVVTLGELRECGLTKRQISVRVRQGRLHCVHRGVYAVGHQALPQRGAFLAAVKACGAGAVLSHFSAAALWQLIDWDDRWPEVTVVRARTPQHSGLLVHRTGILTPPDIRRQGGIPVTSPTRTLIDLAARLDYRRVRRVVGEAQALKLLSIRELAEALHRLGPRRGTSTLRRIVAEGPAPTRSVLEDIVLELILAGRLARPEVNVPLTVAGRRLIPDFRWPSQRLVVEADGVAWHDHRIGREDDAERQALLEAHGERVVRVTWEQAVRQPKQVLERLHAAGAPRESSDGRVSDRIGS